MRDSHRWDKQDWRGIVICCYGEEGKDFPDLSDSSVDLRDRSRVSHSLKHTGFPHICCCHYNDRALYQTFLKGVAGRCPHVKLSCQHIFTFHLRNSNSRARWRCGQLRGQRPNFHMFVYFQEKHRDGLPKREREISTSFPEIPSGFRDEPDIADTVPTFCFSW